jgi:hypothetical protein
MLTPTSAAVLAILTGAALELGVHAVSGRREAWDSEIFWTAGLPLAMLATFAIGWFSRGRAWLATLAVAPAQVLTMMLRSAEFGSLWPLTLILSAVLSAPFVVAAFVGSRFRVRSEMSGKRVR